MSAQSLAARDGHGPERGAIGDTPGAQVIELRPGVSRPAAAQSADHQVAAFWESIFAQQGQTLRNPATAEAHRITAATFGLLIDGALAQGVLTEEQAAYLSGLAVEAVRAPDFLPPCP